MPKTWHKDTTLQNKTYAKQPLNETLTASVPETASYGTAE